MEIYRKKNPLKNQMSCLDLQIGLNMACHIAKKERNYNQSHIICDLISKPIKTSLLCCDKHWK